MLVENPCEELETQLKVFLDHKEEDYEEFAARFDNIRLDLEDIDEVFQIVKHTVTETAAEPYLLSILQHLLCIRDDYFVRLVMDIWTTVSFIHSSISDLHTTN